MSAQAPSDSEGSVPKLGGAPREEAASAERLPDYRDICLEEDGVTLIESSGLEPSRKKPKLADVQCHVCERSFPFAVCVNVGSEAYPAYRCRACHASVRALDRAAESRGEEAKRALAKYKKEKNKAWRMDVLRFRICSPDDPPLPKSLSSALGVDSSGARKDILRQYMDSWSTRWSFQTINDCMLLTKRQFVAWYKHNEGYTATEAEARWANDEAGTVDRERNEKGELMLKVSLPKRIRAIDETSYQKQLNFVDVGGEMGFDDAAVMQIRERMRTDPCHEDLKEMIGHSMASARCSSADDSDTAARCLRASRRSKGSTDGADGLSVSDGVSVTSGSDGKQTVTITCVVAARQSFLRDGKKAIAQHCTRKSSGLAQLRDIVDKVGKDSKDVQEVGAGPLISSFCADRDKLQLMLDDARSWTVESAAQHFMAGKALVAALGAHAKQAEDVHESLKGVRKTQVQDAASGRRKAMLKNSQHLAGLRGQGFPKTLMTFLGTDVFDSFADAEAGKSPVKTTLREEGAGWSRVHVWEKGDTGSVVSALREHLATFHSKTVKGVSTMKNMMNQEGNQCRLMQSWLGSKGKGHDDVVKLPEKPGDDGLQVTVNAAKSYGAPILLVSSKLGFRHSEDDWRYAGVGCFVAGHCGRTLLLCWPMTRVAEAKTAPNDEMKFLEGLSGGSSKARSYMQKHASWVSLGAGDVAWVPWGYHMWMLGEVADTAALVQPCFDENLVKMCRLDVRDTVGSALRVCIEARKAKEPISNFAAPLQKFVDDHFLMAT